METEDINKIKFLVNLDSKEFISVDEIDTETPNLITRLQTGVWTGNKIFGITQLTSDFKDFTNVTTKFKSFEKDDMPFITIEGKDERTETITIHSKRKK